MATLVASASACKGAGADTKPVASLSVTTDAQAAFVPIRDAWNAQSTNGRAKMGRALEAFLAKYPRDGAAPLARAYLVFVRMDENRYVEADVLLRTLELTTPPGATRDLVTIARARFDLKTGNPSGAFDLVRPLAGKVVDATTRGLLQEIVSVAAIEAHRDYEAIAYMDAWLRGSADEEHDAVRAQAVAALAKLPREVLENTLRAMRTAGAQSGYGREIQRLVSERLAQIAIEETDPNLAQWLLSGEASGIGLGDAEGPLAELATTKRGTSSVDGRTIGLLLPTGSSELRDEAAEVMRGVAWALDLPRPSADAGDKTKLSTRDDGGDPERVAATMSELSGEGASVIIAALEPRAAERAVKWGEVHAIPVIVLASPETEIPRDNAFSVGEPHGREIAALGEELVSRGITKLAAVVQAGEEGRIAPLAHGSLELASVVPCEPGTHHSGEDRFPIREWATSRVRAWLVDGPSECSRDLLHDLSLAGSSGLLAVTLDAEGSRARAKGISMIGVAAGQVPMLEVSSAAKDVQRYVDEQGSPPSWWAALGHDAALLARRALSSLPLDATADGAEVSRRRATVKTGLLGARVPLWTTDANGFGGAHALPRELRVVELPAAPDEAKAH